MRRNRRAHAVWTFCLLILPAVAFADLLSFQHLGVKKTMRGNVLALYSDGSLLFEGPDTQHYVIAADDQLDWKEKKTAVKFWSKDQLRAELRKEFGGGFYVQQTPHYTIVHNCDVNLARQAGTILERAYAVFRAHFASKGAFRFADLRLPMVAVIFQTREEYLEATKEELGNTLGWSSGMYSPLTNRFYMYDAFEGNLEKKVQITASGARRGGSALDPRNVELVVHEGTHQLAFNFGIHTRHANNPFWLVEGLATYFESADDSHEGWQRAGNLNVERLEHFERIFPSLEEGFLLDLVTNDEAFQKGDGIGDAYAKAWALTYYLMRAKTTGYVRYVRAVQARGLMPQDEKARIEDFRKAFQVAPNGMEDDFRRYMVGVLAGQKKATAAR